MPRLWKRHLLRKIFNLTLFCFFLILFVSILVDFSIHSMKFLKGDIVQIAKYYAFQSIVYLDIFLPLSFLLALIKVLSDMNTHREIFALFVGGLSIRRLFYPLIGLAFFFSGLCFFNHEYLSPKTFLFLNHFQKQFFSHKSRNSEKTVQSIVLEDQTHLIFSQYDKAEKALIDVFWIKDFNDIRHMEKLKIDTPPIGSFVDHFERDTHERLIISKSHPSEILQDMTLSEKDVIELLTPIEGRSLTELLFNLKLTSPEQKAKAKSIAHSRIIFSLSFFWIVIFIGPMCIRFSRNFSHTYVLAISLFSFICFYTLINSSSILSENLVISPVIANWVPFAIACLLGSKNLITIFCK